MDDSKTNRERGRGVIFFYIGVGALVACVVLCIASAFLHNADRNSLAGWALMFGLWAGASLLGALIRWVL